MQLSEVIKSNKKCRHIGDPWGAPRGIPAREGVLEPWLCQLLHQYIKRLYITWGDVAFLHASGISYISPLSLPLVLHCYLVLSYNFCLLHTTKMHVYRTSRSHEILMFVGLQEDAKQCHDAKKFDNTHCAGR